jgi:ubiquinone/menaquinone biosynthesis C-methylase UbiE
MSLRDAWESEAEKWARWAREYEHDSYWRFGRPNLFALLPPPGRRTLDLGCGEGRLARDLAALGHRVVAVDASPTLLRLAAEADSEGEYLLADAASLPFEDAAFDLVVAYMSLMDIDDMEAAVAEAARVLEPGGRLVAAIVHPINSAGQFSEDSAESRFVIDVGYLKARRYTDTLERDGIEMTFHSAHRPLEAYSVALEAASFLIETIREPVLTEDAFDRPASARWQRIPMFLYLRAFKS